MSPKKMPNYEDIDALFERCNSDVGAAEAHGLLTGHICTGMKINASKWWHKVLDLADVKFTEKDKQLLERVCAASQQQLKAFEFGFKLLLPDDEAPLAERVAAMGAWARGYTAGLTLAGFDPATTGSAEVRETFEDLMDITEVNAQLENPDEEDEAALEEVVEYIRMSAMLIYAELVQGRTMHDPGNELH